MNALLGLDFGEKRVGVAVTDEMGAIAVPLTTLAFRGRQQLLGELIKIVEEYHVAKIIVGLPKTMKGELGSQANKITAHVDWLKPQLEKPWILWDERLTTQEVERVLLEADVSRAKRKGIRDRLAAQRILQSYLDYQKLRGQTTGGL